MSCASRLRVGAWQFVGSPDLARNLAAIGRGLEEAAERGVELLLTQEGALPGYAPADRPDLKTLCPRELNAAEKTLAGAARRHGLALALGTVTFTAAGKPYNSLRLIGPRGRTGGLYHKRALYGEEPRHYRAGPPPQPDRRQFKGWPLGLRLCFEFRFPEYFRELLRQNCRLALVAFSMVGPDAAKLPIARAHLASRAAENGLWLVTANNQNGVANCPTAIVDPDGRFVAETPPGREALVVHDLTPPPTSAVRAQIIRQARALTRRSQR